MGNSFESVSLLIRHSHVSAVSPGSWATRLLPTADDKTMEGSYRQRSVPHSPEQQLARFPGTSGIWKVTALHES